MVRCGTAVPSALARVVAWLLWSCGTHTSLTLAVSSNGTTPQGEEVASFFLDPYSRPAEKRGGAWMDVCVGRSRALGRKPTAYLTCNGSPPLDDGTPSLMTFGEVVVRRVEIERAREIASRRGRNGIAS